ncbi:hypothetical protein [Shewanella amazonensis]|nr:hypothetical protein [Shewanella amazonensis]
MTLFAFFAEVFNLSAADHLLFGLFGGALFLHGFLGLFFLISAHGGFLRWCELLPGHFLFGKNQNRELTLARIDYFKLSRRCLYRQILAGHTGKLRAEKSP